MTEQEVAELREERDWMIRLTAEYMQSERLNVQGVYMTIGQCENAVRELLDLRNVLKDVL